MPKPGRTCNFPCISSQSGKRLEEGSRLDGEAEHRMTNDEPSNPNSILPPEEALYKTPNLTLCVPSCPLWLKVLLFRSRAIPAMTAILAALCLCPSARDPTPHSALLQTKAKVQFERPVKRLSKPLFSVFPGSNPAQFWPSFSVFTVRSAEGRKPFQLACSAHP